MDDIEGKRVFGRHEGATRLVIAAEIGLVSVSVSDGRLGEFGVVHRCSPRDVAAVDRGVAVATDGDVLLVEDGEIRATDFGPAVAVGGEPLHAAGPDGRLARLDDGWHGTGAVDGGVRAIDGDLVAAASGVHRLDGGYAGLADVGDVAAAGPLAAAADGLYALGNGWMDVLAGDFGVVAATDGTAHAATDEALYARSDGTWSPADLPVDGPVVDIAYAECPYAVTREGTLLANPDDEWRAHPLGTEGVVGLAAP